MAMMIPVSGGGGRGKIGRRAVAATEPALAIVSDSATSVASTKRWDGRVGEGIGPLRLRARMGRGYDPTGTSDMGRTGQDSPGSVRHGEVTDRIAADGHGKTPSLGGPLPPPCG